MFCENCGKELKPGARFCDACGAPVPGAAAEGAPGAAETGAGTMNGGFQGGAPAGMPGGFPGAAPGMMQETGPGPDTFRENPENGDPSAVSGTRVTENVYFCPDGKYRWNYEFNMLTNPAILITTLKVMALSFGIVALLIIIFSGGISGWTDPDDLKIIVILILVLAVISVLAYLIVAAMYGWKYQVLFEMDEAGVNHIQMKSQFKKAEAMGWLVALAGAAAGRPTVAGAGMLSATRSSMYTKFSAVRKVKENRGRHTIYVNELLSRNQVYAEDADFDFVLNYIKSHTGK